MASVSIAAGTSKKPWGVRVEVSFAALAANVSVAISGGAFLDDTLSACSWPTMGANITTPLNFIYQDMNAPQPALHVVLYEDSIPVATKDL